MDITLGPGPDGRPLAHDPKCPDVERLRAAGEPLMTMFEISCDLDEIECAKHDCLGPVRWESKS